MGETTVNLQDLEIDALKLKAVEYGMPKEDADQFQDKMSLISTINVLKAKSAESKRVETITPPVDPKEERQTEQKWLGKAGAMRAKLDAQPKVRIMIPCTGKEQPGVIKEEIVDGHKEYVHVSGAYEVVQINGYKTFIPKGKYVEVPQQVADIVADSLQQTNQAGEQFLLNRVDPTTGKPVGDILR